MSLKLVIFDVDGLLLDTERIWKRAWQEATDSLHLQLDPDGFDLLVGKTGQEYENGLSIMLDSCCSVTQFMEEMRRIGMEKLKMELNLKPGAEDILNYLEQNGISRAIATVTCRKLTEERLKRMNIWSRFSHICCGDEIQRRKPFPDIYLRVLEMTGCPPENALVLEDSPVGVEAAWRAGIPCIMVPDITAPGLNEQKRADAIVCSLSEAKKKIEEELCKV